LGKRYLDLAGVQSVDDFGESWLGSRRDRQLGGGRLLSVRVVGVGIVDESHGFFASVVCAVGMGIVF